MKFQFHYIFVESNKFLTICSGILTLHTLLLLLYTNYYSLLLLLLLLLLLIFCITHAYNTHLTPFSLMLMLDLYLYFSPFGFFVFLLSSYCLLVVYRINV